MTPTERKAFEALRESRRELMKAIQGLMDHACVDDFDLDGPGQDAMSDAYTALATARKLTEGAEG